MIAAAAGLVVGLAILAAKALALLLMVLGAIDLYSHIKGEE